MITFALVIYFGVFAIFASYMIFRSTVSNWQKIVLPALFFVSIAWTYIAVAHEKGYPSPVFMPEGDVVSVEIVNPTNDTSGGIYIWVYPQVDNESWKLGHFLNLNTERRPKSYSIPWSKEQAQKYAEIQEQLKNGYLVKRQRTGGNSMQGQQGDQQNRGEYEFIIIDPREANPKGVDN